MNSIQICESDAIRPRHVVLICLTVMTVTGALLLLSAARPSAPVDGAIEWHEGSILRAVVELLCLNYSVPTYHAGAVKNLILGLGAGVAVIVLGLAITAASGAADESEGPGERGSASPAEGEVKHSYTRHKARVAPLVAAQVLVGLYILWSFASSRWSLAPELAIGGSILLAVHFLWAFGLGNGLSAAAARVASLAICVILFLTALVAIWYHYGRNPTLRADFPVGNPVFLGACLIPGVLLAGGLAGEGIGNALSTGRAVPLLGVTFAVLMVIVDLWAFFLADSRGPYVGLLFGVLAMTFFALRGRVKWIPVCLAACVAIAGFFYLVRNGDVYSPTGRSATLRLRAYAWSYAWRMFIERPLTGHGQAGFVLTGDSYVADDVLDDPLVFQSRITHAHNEWLEVMADLGSVGIVLIAAVLILTLRAGMGTLALSPSRGQRWALSALMASLVGLVVEEGFGVGLRVPGVGAVFYTIIGLIWSMSTYRLSGLYSVLSATRWRRMATGVAGGIAGLMVLTIAQRDFSAARNAYRAGEAYHNERFDEAIRLTSLASSQLNPQRALVTLYRLSEAHLRAAEYLHQRARDRERRARATEPPVSRLLALAEEDYRLSDEHCEKGSAALKDLVIRSPGFINHGRLAYWLNLIRARNAAARNDSETQQALLQDAAAAIRREMIRQPFDPDIAVDYVQAAGPALDSGEMLDVLARPLRHHRITDAYMSLLHQWAADTRFDDLFRPAIREAELLCASLRATKEHGEAPETWAPEKLRLAAAIQFIRGEYEKARRKLAVAAKVYDVLTARAPLGAASCYGELAICQFFSEPNDPLSALARAEKAIKIAPQSRAGRELKRSITDRMIEFHLAAGQEVQARKLLSGTAPPGVTPQDVQRELGSRYVRLCESLLGRREANGTLRKPPAQLAPTLRRWVARAIELNPDEPFAHYVAADLAFYMGDDEAAAAHLRSAIDNGLPIELARRFLQLAHNQRPDSQAISSLRTALTSSPTPAGSTHGSRSEVDSNAH